MGGANAKALQASIGGSKAEIKAAFDKFDKDKSGALEGKEATEFVKEVQAILAKSPDENLKKEAAAANPEEWLRKFADTSNDGKLQYKEFEHWAQTVGTDADKVSNHKPSDKKDDKQKDDKHKDDKHKDDKHKDDKHKDEKKEKKDKGDKKDKDEKKEKKDKK